MSQKKWKICAVSRLHILCHSDRGGILLIYFLQCRGLCVKILNEISAARHISANMISKMLIIVRKPMLRVL